MSLGEILLGSSTKPQNIRISCKKKKKKKSIFMLGSRTALISGFIRTFIMRDSMPMVFGANFFLFVL